MIAVLTVKSNLDPHMFSWFGWLVWLGASGLDDMFFTYKVGLVGKTFTVVNRCFNKT